MKPLAHLTIRVAWHDTQWNGSVCAQPGLNTFCTALARIRETKRPEEEGLAGRSFEKLAPDELPPCKSESGYFMSLRPWVREFDHPYRLNKHCLETHGNLKKRLLTVPACAAIAVPFRWMLRGNQKEIERRLPQPLPLDSPPPFKSPWVFGRARQEAIVDLVFGRLVEKKSLVIFYTKEGHPLGDGMRRLVVGIGEITKVGKREHYDTVDGKPGYPLWDRVISHSIRPNEADGFLLPYHEYLAPTGDPAEDAHRAELVQEIVVVPPNAHVGDFSYGSELTDADVVLSILSRALAAVRKIREHGIVPGPWQKREDWLNKQLTLAWQDRGAFPGTGPMLEALGMRLGTALVMDLRASNAMQADKDPWQVLNDLFQGKGKPPDKAFAPDIQATAPTWLGLPPGRRKLLELLSRFDLTPAQAKRVWEESKRRAAFAFSTSDDEILANPYLIAERDLGGGEDAAISLEVIDRGLLPDEALVAAPKIAEPSYVASAADRRRVRCALVTVLRAAGEAGDSLLSLEEALGRLPPLSAAHPILVSPDWIEGNAPFLDGVISRLGVEVKADTPRIVPALQLSDIKGREEKLGKILRARCGKNIEPPNADWKKLIAKAIEANGQKIDLKNTRHKAALEEQAQALEKICSRRLSVLTGGAGTGKTSVVGGLVNSDVLQKEGLLLLAPTGKARVRLQGATNASAMTVAKFLNDLKRYDGLRQRPLFDGKETYRSAKTVVIDEASMLTMDQLYAVLLALDLTHVQRIVLVGDPNQLPPIGIGRPFADLITWLVSLSASDKEEQRQLSDALARLTVEVRSVRGADSESEEQPSDTLRLASWFTDLPPGGHSEQVLSRVCLGESLNDLEIAYWSTTEELRERLLDQFQKHLSLTDSADVAGFNKSFGFADEGWIKRDDPDGIENWQLLSPTRMHPYGVVELNRWIQGKFRAKEKQSAREHRGVQVGDEGIVKNDKVIQLRNGERDCYFWETKEQGTEYLANGEIGGAAAGAGGFLNVFFAGRPMVSFGYRSNDFGEDGVPLELAYALTIHKAQGSQFRTVFVVLPKTSRLLTRELVYTSLTRSRERLVLLIEGDNAGVLYDLSRPEKSDACRRNTNLFGGILRERSGEPPHAENLIHKTEKGHMVRSKSELVIANLLQREGINYEYEQPLDGEKVLGRLHPDFSFADAAGDRVIWEHLGMMHDDEYVRGWNWKLEWYRQNGFVLDQNLFVSEERRGQGLNMDHLRGVAEKIKELVA
jgi:hypothetical protein